MGIEKHISSVTALDKTLDPRACGQRGSMAECFMHPPANKWVFSPVRRTCEVGLALAVILVLAVPMLILALCIRLTSRGPSVFSQERVGKRGRLFRIYKFRSMTETGRQSQDTGLTQANDCRITPLGRFMRKFKIDELPQFYNILRGDMSLIGPRPKLPRYAVMFNLPYRPGITGRATTIFSNEEELIRGIDPADLDKFYAQHITPVKARLDICYMCRATPLSDLRIVADTVLCCIRPALTLNATHNGKSILVMRSCCATSKENAAINN